MIQLSERDSNPRVEDAAERHMRLCDQNPGAAKYSAAIKPPYDDFMHQQDVQKAAKKAVNSAVDTKKLSYTLLDDAVRKVQGRAKEYDNANPGSSIQTLLLPNGNITEILKKSIELRPAEVHKISVKIVSLGSTHPLFPLAAELDAAVENCTQKEKLLKTAEDAKKDADTNLYLAKVALAHQYNTNFFDAASDTTKAYAERLFPNLRPSNDDDDDDSGTTTPSK